ncbi:UDP-N-acetylmuramoyl-L-alanyl-D-glutamate--2,6-diaminopimelate ligase [bacterium]|nr:UDP-N-acetylmuramoyl-L-alanyl-D-glutamate--2,6-diaminopimelate ligase [bacterium]
MIKEIIKKFIPPSLLSFYHFCLSFLGALIYRFPSRKIKVIGVTGTNGKTTVTEMISKILEKGGYEVALLNSVRFKIKDKEWSNTLRMTMPGRLQIQKILRQAVKEGCDYAVLEVTSEGIKQHRHRFIDFKVAVFTNLTPEHIEAHGSFENYKRAKGKLFQATKEVHVINLDDRHAEYFLQFLAKEKYLYKLKSQTSNLKVITQNSKLLEAENCRILPNELKFTLNNINFNLKLLGRFNIYNALAAICVGLSQGIPLETCQRALESFQGVPGRMEKVISHPFKVIVDYAFTPNALRKVYETLQNSKLKTQNSKLICVLGSCGGGRDRWKRPVLGNLAAQYCDEVIVTNEDPYDEDPVEIIEQVAKGTKGKARKILDRRRAIKEALKLAKPKDVVVITGKGCESSICVAGGKKIPWDDRRVVREEFKKLRS